MKKLSFLTLFIFNFLLLNAQNFEDNNVKKRNSIDFDFGFGVHALDFDLYDYGNNKVGGGFLTKIGYNYLFCDNFGISTSIQFFTINSTSNLNFIQSIDNISDIDGKYFIHRSYYTDLKENQYQLIFSIPIEFFYIFPKFNKFDLCFGLGVQPQFVVCNKFKTVSGFIETRAFYSDLNIELSNINKYNFDKYKNFEGEYNLKNTFSVICDLRILYHINNSVDFIYGFYGLYSLNSQIKGSDNYIFNPSNSDNSKPTYNAVLNFNEIKNIRPFSVGFQIGFRKKF